MQKYPIIENDWTSVRKAIQKMGSASGLGPTATPTFAGLTLTGLDASEFVFTNASKTLVSINVPLVVAYGGTGAATLTDHSLLVGSGTDAITALGAATNGKLPIGSTGADPVLATLTGTANQITVTNGAGSITLSTPQDLDTACDFNCASLTATGTVQAEQLTSTDDISANGNLYLDNGGQSYVYGGDETGEDLILRANTVDAKDYYAAYGDAGLLLNFSTGNNISFVENDTAEYTFDASTFDAKSNDITTTGSGTFSSASLGTGELTCGSINRAADTLTLEIGGTAEISISATASTFGGNIVIPDAGTIGSASDTDIMTLAADGTTTFSVFPVTPSAAPDADYEVANKKYVDDNAGGADNYTVKIDAAATAGYIGAASNDGVLRTDGSNITYTDGGDFITLNTAQDIQTTSSPTFANVILADGGALKVADASPQIVLDNTNGYIEMTGDVGIGTTAPQVPLHVSADGNAVNASLVTSESILVSDTGTAPSVAIMSAGDAAGDRGVIKCTRSDGTLAIPTAPADDDMVFSLLGAIWDGTAVQGTAAIDMYVDGNVSEDVAPQRISFVTSETTGAARAERMVIYSGGDVEIKNSLGIGTATPDTQLEVAGTSPVVTIHNTTETNAIGARDCGFIAKGEQDGGEISTLGSFLFIHDTSADDEAGRFIISLNDGNDGDTPGTVLTIKSTTRMLVYRDFDSGSGAGYNLGDATYYWNDVSYKTLTDRGCLGSFDNGVELQDGRIVSDVEALNSIGVRTDKQTVYGVPMLDYKSMPKAVYKPATDKEKLLPRNEKDEPYNFDDDGNIIPAADGAEMTALFSIMIGAIKELNQRIIKLEQR